MRSVFVLVLVTLLGVLGCADKVRRNETGAGPATPLQHKADQCPQIVGDYQKDSTNQKSFKIASIANGIQFTDSDVEYTIDGGAYVPRGNKELTYTGGCENQSIVIDVYEGTVYLGRMKYSLSGENQLLIETTALDSRLGEDGKEVWQARPEL